MTFYRPGGSGTRLNAQQDYVYTDNVGDATGWLPIQKGDSIAVNVCHASINYQSAAASVVTKSPFNVAGQVVLEMKMFGGEADGEAWPIDLWQNLLVATDRRAHRAGWVRLRLISIDASAGGGAALALQISRTGETGAVT